MTSDARYNQWLQQEHPGKTVLAQLPSVSQGKAVHLRSGVTTFSCEEEKRKREDQKKEREEEKKKWEEEKRQREEKKRKQEEEKRQHEQERRKQMEEKTRKQEKKQHEEQKTIARDLELKRKHSTPGKRNYPTRSQRDSKSGEIVSPPRFIIIDYTFVIFHSWSTIQTLFKVVS